MNCCRPQMYSYLYQTRPGFDVPIKKALENIKLSAADDPGVHSTNYPEIQKENKTRTGLQIKLENKHNEKRLLERFKVLCCIKKFGDEYYTLRIKEDRRKNEAGSTSIQNGGHISNHQISNHLLPNEHIILHRLPDQKHNFRQDIFLRLICSHVIKDHFSVCDNSFLRKTSEYSIVKSYNHRKLLHSTTLNSNSDNDLTSNIVQTGNGGAGENQSMMEITTYNGLTLARWKEFLENLNQSLSRDHIWAGLSLVCLIVIMMFAMKVCGLKPMDRSHERHMDYVFHEFDHTVSIREIIALRKPYLPKSIVQFTKRWKWKRKKKPLMIKERDIVDRLSDNSDDERRIYSQPMNDF